MYEKETSQVPRLFVSYSYSDLMDNRKQFSELIDQFLKENGKTYNNSEPNDNSEKKNKLKSDTNPQESE